MNKIFVKTQNVKNFIGLVENLINKPKNIPKMGLVYGEPGLGKSQTALWLACKYDGIYLRASNFMTGRWLLEEMVKELDEIPRFLTSDNFNIVVKKLKQNPQVIFIETVVLLSKGEVDSKKIRVEFSLEDMDMSEFQDGATYTQIKDYVLEHSGLKVSNLYISQIKRKCGIEVGKNYNLPKSEDSRQPLCPPEKEKAIREAFKYFGII